MGATCSFETSVDFQPTTRHNIPEYRNLIPVYFIVGFAVGVSNGIRHTNVHIKLLVNTLEINRGRIWIEFSRISDAIHGDASSSRSTGTQYCHHITYMDLPHVHLDCSVGFRLELSTRFTERIVTDCC
jgi:hypothetical protein